MLKDKNVNLRIIEQDDFDEYAEWINNIEVMSEFLFGRQRSVKEIESHYSTRTPEFDTFM